METCGGKCAKCLLFLYNIIFVISGAGVLGTGIWIRYSDNIKQLSQLLNFTGDGTLYTAVFVFIGCGAFLIMVGFFGCCGAAMENKCMLGSYVFFLVLIFAGELAGGILAAVYNTKTVDGLQLRLDETFSAYEARTNKTPGNAVAIAWDYVQVWLKCCGAYSYMDYSVVNFPNPTRHVPDSCCVLTNSDPNDPKPKNPRLCQQAAEDFDSVTNPSDYLHEKNCFSGIEDMLTSQAGTMIVVGVGIVVLQFLGIALACCVCRGRKRNGYEYQPLLPSKKMCATDL